MSGLLATGCLWFGRFCLGTLALFWLSALTRAIRAQVDEKYRLTVDSPAPDSSVSVGVVVPARNEVRNIGPCIESVLRQDHASIRLVVLNDGSTDGTDAVLAEYASESRLTIMEGGGGPLPEGWLGKAWACQRGAGAMLEAESPPEWLLFIDADVVLEPHAVSAAVGHAVRNELAMVSGLGRLVMLTFWEKVLQPVVAGLIMAGNDLEKINDPEKRDDRPLANGQFILLRRDAYKAVGGHEAVRADVLDDVGMSSAVTAAGFPYNLVFMRTLFSCRMYESLGDLWEGWTKNMFAGMRHNWGILLFVCGFLAWIALVPYLLLVFGLLTDGTEWIAWGGGLVLLIQSVRLWLDIQVGQDVRYGPTQVFGVIMTLVLLIHSGIRATRGTASWKGRTVPVVKPVTDVTAAQDDAGSDST